MQYFDNCRSAPASKVSMVKLLCKLGSCLFNQLQTSFCLIGLRLIYFGLKPCLKHALALQNSSVVERPVSESPYPGLPSPGMLESRAASAQPPASAQLPAVTQLPAEPSSPSKADSLDSIEAPSHTQDSPDREQQQESVLEATVARSGRLLIASALPQSSPQTLCASPLSQQTFCALTQ